MQGVFETLCIYFVNICQQISFLTLGDFHADFSGHALGEGPGKGKSKSSGQLGGAGGGHGGRGGPSRRGIHWAFAYGSTFIPEEMGSGGGRGNDGDGGGRGGGKIKSRSLSRLFKASDIYFRQACQSRAKPNRSGATLGRPK